MPEITARLTTALADRYKETHLFMLAFVGFAVFVGYEVLTATLLA